jgi:ribonucleoside-diphosphate reductase alpha chain
MKITRKFTTAGQDPFATVKWVRRSSRITNPDGTVVFEMNDAEVPETWSQLATDIMVSKYFRRAGVPQVDAHGQALMKDGKPVLGGEKSARAVIHRLAGCWRHWGEGHGYFDASADAQAFYDELVYMMVHQMGAPNSPQWFNTGLNWAYGLTGPAQGHFVPDPATGDVRQAADAYTHPQPHACYIQSITDDLVNPGGIMDLWTREARLFKYGSGTGTNFSKLRAENEPLSGGGKSSGLMSWLKIGDRAAGAIKSGGTTRRAAKMVCLDMDHPDIEKFINWKVREEIKVAAMVEGMKHLDRDQQETARRLGLKLDYDFNGEAYATVSGQNSNNSVRIPDEFFEAIDADAQWQTHWRTGSRKPAPAYKARDLWDQISFAAWRCADPGVQFDSTINAWHTCPNAGRINASNPCSEYMFLDNTACNLASLNVLQFYDATTRVFDVESFEHAVDLWTIVLEISVLMAAYPSEEVARLSWRYRTLGLGYANLGAMLMQAGIAYDSEAARAICGCISAILTGRSYRQSALMAAQLGPFAGFAADRENMLRVMRNHARAAHGVPRDQGQYEGLKISPVPINHGLLTAGAAAGVNVANARELLEHAMRAWDEAVSLGETHGYRNAQTTVIAPTGTIGLLMDCDTTGIEPDFALVKFKKLAGGGYFKIANASVRPALEAMGYADAQIREIMAYLLGRLNVDVPMPAPATGSFRDWLLSKGLAPDDIAKINDALPGVVELGFAFMPWSLGDDALRRLGLDPDKAKADPRFDTLAVLGLSPEQVDRLNEAICGTQTIEDAPHLRPEHLPVFDCANKCGRTGRRFIAPEGHIRMMAAAQPFISGAISKTINLPNEATVEDIKRCYRLSWELGLKANALYRDGCKLSQPLSATADSEKNKDGAAAAETAAKKAVASTPPAAGARPAAPTPPQPTRSLEPAAAPAPAAGDVRVVQRPMRRRLQDTRASITHKFNIAGHEGYLTVGLYEDGMPGELFITMAKEGSTIGGLMDSLGTAVSVALQYGVPIESLVNKFTHQRFEPAGMTTNRDIPFAKSLVDYIFRWMGMEFIPGYREAVAPKRPGDPRSTDAGAGHDAAPHVSPSVRTEYTGHFRHGAEAAAPAPAARSVKEDDPSWTHAQQQTGAGGIAGADRVMMHSSHRRAGPDADGEDGSSNGSGSPGVSELLGSVTVMESVLATTRTRSAAAGALARTETERVEVALIAGGTSSLSLAMQNNMGDAPACDGCGAITVRSGTCYKCLNCGNSMGCS